MRISLLVAAAVAALAVPLLAQEATPVMPQLGETVEVSIVNVDVYVTNAAGQRVLGLKPEDFVVFENGKEQALTNFAEYRGDALPARMTSKFVADGTTIVDKPPRRTMVIFIDGFTLQDRQIEPMFSSMKRLLRNTVRKGDGVAVLTWRGSALDTRQEFTDDVHLLERVLDQIRYEQTLGARDAGQQIAGKALVPYAVRSSANRRLSREIDELRTWKATMGSKAVSSGGREGTETAIRSAALDAYFDMKQKSKALTATITSLAGLDGKKSIIFASNRFSVYPGAEYYYITGSDEVPASDRANLEGKPLIDSVVAAANAHGVTIYPFYPAGLGSMAGPDAEEVRLSLGANAASDPNQDYKILTNETAALANVAIRTGGVMAFGADVAKTLTRVQEDLDGYYSLAYRTPPGAGDSARQVTVKARNPEYVVRARREYVERSDSSRMKDRVLAVLYQKVDPRSTVPFKVDVDKAKRKGRGEYLIPVTIRIPVSSLATLPQEAKRVGAFSVYLATGGEIGRIGDVTQQTQPFFINDGDVAGAQRKYISYTVELLVDPGATRVAVGVLDEVSREHGLQQLTLPKMK